MLKKIRGKIENNPVYKFRQFWESLNHREQDTMWNILVILRGEDGGSTYLKAETTGRIRAELFKDMECGILERLSSQVVISPEACPNNETPDVKETLNDHTTDCHWRDHFISAVNSLAKYVCKREIRDLLKIIWLDRG